MMRNYFTSQIVEVIIFGDFILPPAATSFTWKIYKKKLSEFLEMFVFLRFKIGPVV